MLGAWAAERFLAAKNPAIRGKIAPGYGGIPIHSMRMFSETAGNSQLPFAVNPIAVHSDAGEGSGSLVPRLMLCFQLLVGMM